MTLEDMLSYTREYLDDASVALVEGDNDVLYSDKILTAFMNEAAKILCRRAWVIVEYGVPPAGVITLRTGVSLYPIHASVLRIFDITPTTQVSPLGRTEDIHLRNTNLLGTDGDLFSAYEIGERASLAGSLTNTAGPPLAFASDAASRTIRVFPPPTSVQNGLQVTMKIARLPIKQLSLDDTSCEPEVPEEWHIPVCHYAAGRALVLPNVDGDQKMEGRRLLAEFDETVRQARQERQRAEAGGSRWEFNSSTATLGRRNG